MTVSLAAQPATGVIRWGLSIDAARDEYFTGLMERVVDGPQQASWAPGITAAMNLRGQKVDCLVKPTLSVYAPFYLSSRGYSVFVQGTWPGHFDFAAANPERVAIEFEGPSLSMVINTAGTPAELVRAHALDAGPPFLPPKWMFSPWRWRDEHTQRTTYYDGTPVAGPFNSEVMEDVLMMKAFGIPNGVYWIDRPWGLGSLGLRRLRDRSGPPAALPGDGAVARVTPGEDGAVDHGLLQRQDGHRGAGEGLRVSRPDASRQRQQLPDGGPDQPGRPEVLAGRHREAAGTRRGGIQAGSRRREHPRRRPVQDVRRPLDPREAQSLHLARRQGRLRREPPAPRRRLLRDAAGGVHRHVALRRVLGRRHRRHAGGPARVDHRRPARGRHGLPQLGLRHVRLQPAAARTGSVRAMAGVLGVHADHGGRSDAQRRVLEPAACARVRRRPHRDVAAVRAAPRAPEGLQLRAGGRGRDRPACPSCVRCSWSIRTRRRPGRSGGPTCTAPIWSCRRSGRRGSAHRRSTCPQARGGATPGPRTCIRAARP